MGIGQIQFGGLASGLDTSAIISAILNAERNPIRLLERQKDDQQSRLSLIGTLEGLVETLQKKASELTGESFFAFSTTSSDEGVAAFSVDGGALEGSYEIDVQQLASADRHAFQGVTDPDTDLGAGTISFTYSGTDYTIDVDAASSSLDEIAAQINSEAGDAVHASVINVGADGNPSYQLVLSGGDTGADYQISSLSATYAELGSATEITDAQNARVAVDSLVIERSSNEFADVLEGVTFTARSEGTTTFAVSVDTEGTKEQLEELLDAYNDVVDFMNGQNAFSEEGGPGGALFGDSVLRSVRSALQGALFDVDLAVVQADTEGYSTLGLVGVDLGSDGRLSIKDSVFDAKLAANRDALASFFSDESEGLFAKLDEAISALVDTETNENGVLIEGAFDRRRTTINSLVKTYDSQIDRIEDRLSALEESLVLQFSNLESLLSGLQSQSSFLAASLLQQQ